ncbi:hypothetical protein ACWEOZ_13125 [Actinoplanes sp. NPDC004185]
MDIDYLTTGLTGFSEDEFPEARGWPVAGCPTRVVGATEAQMRAWTLADVPCGTLTEPYHDTDQGWNVMLWQQGDHVFVAEGDGGWDEVRDSNTYTRWFKVPRELYFQAWAAALEQLRSL